MHRFWLQNLQIETFNILNYNSLPCVKINAYKLIHWHSHILSYDQNFKNSELDQISQLLLDISNINMRGILLKTSHHIAVKKFIWQHTQHVILGHKIVMLGHKTVTLGHNFFTSCLQVRVLKFKATLQSSFRVDSLSFQHNCSSLRPKNRVDNESVRKRRQIRFTASI